MIIMNLKKVHQLAAENKISDAIEILESLSIKFPEFSLYKEKMEGYRKLLGNNGGKISPTSKTSRTALIKSPPKQNANLVEKIAYGSYLGAYESTSKARAWLSSLLKENKENIQILVELAKLDMADERFKDALTKAKIAIRIDKNQSAPFKIAEQASIELGDFKSANQYFLDHPKHKNPPEPRKRGKNPTLGSNFVLPPNIGEGNDYTHILYKSSLFTASREKYTKRASIIVPVYNRHKILANTLAALTHQTYPNDLMDIIVVDDGSNDGVFDVIRKYESKLHLYYGRQIDKGFRVSAARNIGLKMAKGDSIILLDADILPCPNDIENYMKILHVADDAVLIGHRRYVDVSNITDDQILANPEAALNLPSINPNNDVADHRDTSGESIDWRLPVYKKTNNLINDPWPFTKGAAGNLAFSKKLLAKAGLFDEEFTAWGCEDTEFSYRLYNAGAYFIPMLNIVSLHQEPLGNKTENPSTAGESFRAAGHRFTKNLLAKKCPSPVTRKYSEHKDFTVPKVSIYIPAYNAEQYIVDAINSCLKQNFDDLEICICNDGSTDNTLDVLSRNFGNNPKVRWVTQPNSGIGAATNTAIAMCRGLYIGQLDADDLLKQGAVRACVQVLDSMAVDAVYTDCDYIDSHGNYIRDGWCGGEFEKEWMATGMIATHFRMFRKRTWNRTSGCNERIKNAVDLDLWLKLNEKAKIHHIHDVFYSYRWHGTNTSIRERKLQEKNHLRVVEDSLSRIGMSRYWQVKSTGNKLNPREFQIAEIEQPVAVTPKDIIILIPTCLKYKNKAAAVRDTWKKNAEKIGFRCFFLMGDPTIDIAKVQDDTIYVPCRDDYESLLVKLCMGYEFIYKSISDFTHIYKIDDDCFLNLDKLVKDILPQLAYLQYAGGATHPKGAKMNNKWHFGKCSDANFDKPYKFDKAPYEFAKGGYGYFLRKDILPLIYQKKDELLSEIDNHIYSFEDVRISEILGSKNILAKLLKNYHIGRNGDAPPENLTVIFDISNPSEIKDLNESKKTRRLIEQPSLSAL
ncbi:hypothetical protein CEK28_13450 [Xenophilus sp. AP218F]|nr:hypothetical protein CEK28_13450 [Xenophilus sp. AP218F]